jgi:hypothetical protein
MKINTEYAESKKTQSNVTVVNAKLCFENLRCGDYKEGYLVTERNLAQEKKGSPLCELASFANIIVDKCNMNESNPSIYVSAIVNSEEKMQHLYEWIDKYAGKDKAETIAPGLLEALGMKSDADKIDEEENSVAKRFAKYRKLYEDVAINEDDSVSEDEDEDKSDDKSGDNSNDKPAKDEPSGDEDTDKKEDEPKDDEEEQDELTAVILEVKKGDEDKLKDELVEAGVDEDDIEIITEEENKDEEDEDKGDEKNEEDEAGEDEDKDETVKVKVAVNSFDALKEYLEGKGFNLEEELGGEIVSDDSDSDSEDGDSEDGDSEDDGASLDAEFDGFDDLFK